MRKKIKKTVKLLMCMVLIATTLVGCVKVSFSKKESVPMTATEFKTQMEEKGFTVTDQTDSAADSTYQEIYVAVEEEKYSFEYYFMKDPNAAEVVYQYAVSNLNNTYKEDEKALIVEAVEDTTANYNVSADDYYCEVIKKENTVLYVTAYSDYKEDAQKIIAELEK